MTTNTKARPKPAAPKPQAPKPAAKAPEAKPNATPKSFDNVPETDAPAPASKAGTNSAYAPEEVRETMRERQAQLRADGWTRPAISAITGFSDSQVWRAQNGKVHTAELERWMTFIKTVDAGEHKPPASARKPRVEDLQAKITAALAKLSDEAKTAAQYRALINEAKALLEA